MANAQTIQLHLKAIGDFSDVTSDISQVQQMLGKLNLPPNLKKSFETTFQELSRETTKYQKILDSGFKKKGDVTGLESSGARINKLLTTLKADMSKIDPSILQRSFQVDPSQIDALKQKMSDLRSQFTQRINSDQFDELRNKVQGAANAVQEVSKSKHLDAFLRSLQSGDMAGAQQALDKLKANIDKFKSAEKQGQFGAGIKELQAALNQLKGDSELGRIANEIMQTDHAMDQLDADELQRFIQAFAQGAQGVDRMSQEVVEFTSKTRQAAQSQMSFSTQLDQLKSQVGYFFGMTNAVYLLRSALQSALNTVKELDEVMTQTAVVTDMSVGDMWDKLPEYTKNATALGVAVKDLYSATTLYYQQGLTGQKVMDVGIETMKMAAIANMEAEESTQAMTAALRGFNMEVNETNAQTVNDVYSKLAAITAADTGQIATAMTKTASIASNANMEFETTAALLAQIIETTQEAPETAGTALKTIIARFSEVKALKDQGKNTGEDEEGESINVNNIDKALKTVGISMDSFFAGTEGLDDVLLRLAEKWETLDFETQRYIATMAAGSRQQSRFIAMMSDYSRTTELVAAAEGSAGASQQQWSKTTESLQYKLNQLANAWDQFLMSIANNAIIKAGVDILMALLTTINNITGSLPGFTSGLANLLLVFVALQAGGKLISALFTTIAAKFAAGGKAAGISFKTALAQEFSGIGKIFTKAGWKVPPLHTKTQQASLNKLSLAYKNAQTSQRLYTNAVNNSIGSQTTQAALQDKATVSQAAYNTALAQTSAELGLDTAQQAAFTAMVGAGIGVESAAIAAKNGLTVATYNEMAAKVAMMGLSGEEAKQKLAEMVATYNLIAAKNAESTTDGLLVTQKLGLLAVVLFGSKAKKAEMLAHWETTAAKLAESGATWTLTIANWALQASFGAILLVITLIIAAVALLVIGIKHFQNNTPEAKMKKLKEEAEAAAEAADEAKQAFADMLEERKGYKETQKALSQLTEGTTAWKEKLQEANEQAADLVSKYPQLKLIFENGQLTVDEESWDTLQNSLSTQARNTQLISLMKQDAVDFANFSLFANSTTQTTTTSDSYNTGRQPKVETSYQDFDQPGQILGLAVELNKVKQRGGLKTLGTSSTDSSGYIRNTEDSRLKEHGDGSVTTETIKTEYKSEDFVLGDEYTVYSDDLKHLAELYGTTAHDLYENFDAIQLYAERHAETMYNIFALGATAEQQASKYYANITEGLANTVKLSDVQHQESEEWARGDLWQKGSDSTTASLQEKMNKYNEENKAGLEISGNEAQDMATYYKALTGEEYDYKEAGMDADDELAKKIADAEVAQTLTGYVDELYDAANKYTDIGNVFRNDLDMTASIEQVKALGEEANLSDAAMAALVDQYEDLETQRRDIDKTLVNIVYKDDEEYLKQEFQTDDAETNEARAAAFTKGFAGNYKNAQKFLSSYNQMLVAGGEGMAALFVDAMQAKTQQERFDNINYFSKIDWSSSIEGAAALKKMLNEDSLALSEFALKAQYAGTSFYSMTSQANELYSLIGEEGLKELAKDGEITATEMLELAKDCEEVNTVLDTTGLSASTLASYYEKLEDGTLDMVSASSSFLSVLEKLNAASGAIEDSFAFIDTFEVERSQTEIGKTFSEMYAEMEELYNKGAYSDAQLIDYAKTFIGEENWGDLIREKGGDMKKAMNEVMAMLPQNGENMYQSWKKFAQMDNSGMTSLGANGGINFDMKAIGSVENLKQQLMKTLKISDVMAEAMLADAQTFSSDFGQKLKSLSLGDALTEWIASAVEVNGQKIISEKELQAFAQDAGLDPEVLRKQLEAEDLPVKIKVTPYLNEDGTLSETMRQTLIQQFKEAGSIDLDQAYQMLLEIGLDDEEAKKELRNMAGSFEGMEVSANGETLGTLQKDLKTVSKNGAESGTWEGLVDGVKDPAVKAAQELSALEQGQMTAIAMTNGMTVAISGAMIMMGKMFDQFTASLEAKYGKLLPGDLSTNLEGAMSAGLSGYSTSAENEVNAIYADKIKTANTNLATLKTQKEEKDEKAGKATETIMDNLDVKTEKSGSYEDDSQQTIKEDDDSSTSDPWENEYDKQYNLARKINAELRSREKLELEYERILNRNAATTEKLLKNREQQLASLEEERKMREHMLSKRQEGMQEIQSEYSDVGRYAYYDEELGKVQIDWNALEQLEGSTNEELTERVEEYISKLEEQEGLIEEEQDSLDEINDGVWEIYEQGKDTYFDLETRIKDALISERQDEIDKLSDINSSITDLNSSLLDALQKQIDDYRQARDNERAEQDIIDQQQRLAYLQQDTSGANQLEILKLQEEIDSATEDYTDTLVDQKISELQDQNDAAAEQRQYQIDLMQAQLDNYSESQEIWQDVYNLVKTGTDASGNLLSTSSLVTLLKSADGFAYMSTLGQMDWLNTLETDVSEALSWLKLGATQTMLGEGKTVTFTDKNGKTLTGVVDKNGNIVTDEGVFKADTLSMDMEGNITSSMAIAPPPPPPPKAASTPSKEENGETKPVPGENEKLGVSAAIWNGNQGWGKGSTRKSRLAEIFGEGNNVQSKYVNNKVTSGYSGKVSDYSYEKMKAKYAYKTGGLADFTGPAWLDGTKSKPEYVLNATQTKAFLALVDVMESLRTSPKSSTTTENSGDNIYDIDINVESIGSDYDVEQMATAIKNLINEDAQYRNNNAISLMR